MEEGGGREGGMETRETREKECGNWAQTEMWKIESKVLFCIHEREGLRELGADRDVENREESVVLHRI